MKLFSNLKSSIVNHKKHTSFVINDEYFSYEQLAFSISKIRKNVALKCKKSEKNIGLVTNDDLETYASIIALWFEGKAYVPLNPEAPIERNMNIIDQADISSIIDSSQISIFKGLSIIHSKLLPDTKLNLEPKEVLGKELAYIMFTSGTTGVPKGVPITRDNLESFIDSYWRMGLKIDEEDRFLQMFDLTFDLSVWSYLVPLLKGASVFTIPKDKIKYGYIFKLIDEYKLTFTLMVPSILQYLRQHFDEINSPELKYSLFCGEALPEDVTLEWASCIPNAQILNVYGPTENTIFCTFYEIQRTAKNKSANGIISIGKAMDSTKTIIIDDNQKILPNGIPGELCLGGEQLTPDYWKNESKNKVSFFNVLVDNINHKYYKTGDICMKDSDGDLMYLGRVDQQIQIQGFRVELGEIEHHAKMFLEKINAVAIPFPDAIGNTQLGLVLESNELETNALFDYLRQKLPLYMVPKKVKFIETLPLNINGKTDRKKILNLFINEKN